MLSGSDESNIRMWKAKVSQKLGKLAPREEASLEYAEALRNRYQYHPRIARHRHVPKMVHKAAVEKRIIFNSHT